MTNNFKGFNISDIKVPIGNYNDPEYPRLCIDLNNMKITQDSPATSFILPNTIRFYIAFDNFGNPYAHQKPPQFDSYRFLATIPTNGLNLLTAYAKQIRLAYEDIIRNTNFTNVIRSPPKPFTIPESKGLHTDTINKNNRILEKLKSAKEPVKKEATVLPNNGKEKADNGIIDNFNIDQIGIGGLSEQLKTIFQNVFASRILSKDAKKMDISPVRGILLYGPPGCGKTLIARNISKLIKAKSYKYVSGPEIKNQYVGRSEENIRKLFKEAEDDRDNNIPGIHVIVFDEFDSIAENRDNFENKSSGVDKSIVNQLLTKIDGVDSLDNILLIALTNRKNSLDPALLRPGRFETHIEITLPDYEGRKEIFNIYLKKLADNNYLDNDINVEQLAEMTSSYSGAEIRSIINSAGNKKLSSKIDLDTFSINNTEIKLKNSDFIEIINETVPQMAESLTQINNISLDIIKENETELVNNITQEIKLFLSVENKDSLVKNYLINGKTSSINRITASITKRLLQDINYTSFITPEYYMQKGKTLWKLFEITKSFDNSLFIVNSFDTIMGYDSKSLDELKIILNSIVPPNRHVIVIVTSSDKSLGNLKKLKGDFSSIYNIE